MTRSESPAATLAALTLAAAFATANACAEPICACRYVERYDRWGHWHMIKVCDVY